MGAWNGPYRNMGITKQSVYKLKRGVEALNIYKCKNQFQAVYLFTYLPINLFTLVRFYIQVLWNRLRFICCLDKEIKYKAATFRSTSLLQSMYFICLEQASHSIMQYNNLQIYKMIFFYYMIQFDHYLYH